MDSVSIYMSVVGGIFSAIGLFVAYMAHRQRLEDEAEEDSRDAHSTPAE